MMTGFASDRGGYRRRSFLAGGMAGAAGIALAGRPGIEDALAVSTVTTASVRDYGAVGNGVADDTQAIKNALAAHRSVAVPPGIYKVTSQIEIPKGKGLYGSNVGSGPRFAGALPWDLRFIGSVIAVAWGSGGENPSNSAFKMRSFSVITGLQFWYPNQSGSTASPTMYPPTIALAANDAEEGSQLVTAPTVEDCQFINPWIAMDFTSPHALLTVRDVTLASWKGGMRVDRSVDVDRISDVQMTPNTMYRGNWPTNGVHAYNANTAGTFGLEIGHADHIMIERCFTYGYYRGLWIHPVSTNADGTPNAPNGILIDQCGFEGTRRPVQVLQAFRRVVMTGCLFGADNDGVSVFVQATADNIPEEVSFVNCTSWGSGGQAFVLSSVDHVRLVGCSAYGAVSQTPPWLTPVLDCYQVKGLLVVDCFFEASGNHQLVDYANFYSCTGFVISDCHFSGAQRNGAGFDVRNSSAGRLTNAFVRGNSSGVYQLNNVNFTADVISI